MPCNLWSSLYENNRDLQISVDVQISNFKPVTFPERLLFLVVYQEIVETRLMSPVILQSTQTRFEKSYPYSNLNDLYNIQYTSFMTIYETSTVIINLLFPPTPQHWTTIFSDYATSFITKWNNPHNLFNFAPFVQTVANRITFRKNLYELRENRQIKPKTFMSMVSNLLYERRFGPYFVEPVIAGLDPKTSEPYVAALDLIGCPMETKDFVVSGTCSEQMYGMCESLWEPDLEPDDLFETISQALMNAVDRDAVSGWGGIVHVIEKDKVTTRTLKARMD